MSTENGSTADPAANAGATTGEQSQSTTQQAAPQDKQTDNAAPNAETKLGDKPADTSTDGKAEGDEKGETKAEAPESYSDFTLPEGVALDKEVLDEFKTAAKELNLSQDAAQKIADLGAKMTLKNAAAMEAKLTEVKAGWLESSRADKEIGGDAYDTNVAAAKSVFDAFGTPALKDLLDSSGLGNHPEMIRWAHRVSKHVSPDTIVTGRQQSGQPSDARKFYPNSQHNT